MTPFQANVLGSGGGKWGHPQSPRLGETLDAAVFLCPKGN